MKAITLGELEKQIMDIVWEEDSISVRGVIDKLDKKLAYTTIATVLQRLYEKGLVVRVESKNGYSYSPKISKEKYSQNVAKSFVKNFMNSFGDTAIASFADSIDKLPREKRNDLLKLIDRHDKNK